MEEHVSAQTIDQTVPVQDKVVESIESTALELSQKEAATYKDKWLRAVAELDNTRKRIRKECEDAVRSGKEIALKRLLPVFDNLERATISAVGAKNAKTVIEGLNIVTNQFNETLRKLEVQRIVTIGQEFNPKIHEAVQSIESEEPVGTIINELQAGYMIGEYVIRAAMVTVSKGK